jgi:uncharacterized membrane protein YphA (DoxX/SURF4 family)
MTSVDFGTVVWPPPVDLPRQLDLGNRHHAPQPLRASSAHVSRGESTLSQLLVLIPIRVFLAAGWLRAGTEKAIDARWWNGDSLRSFLDTHRANAVPTFRPIIEHAIQPYAVVVAFIVMATELACGVAITVGRPLRAALRWAVVLNTTIILCGQVNPSVFYLIMEIVLLMAIAEGTIGTRPTKPSRRTFALGGVMLLAAGFLSLHIRTIAPATVINDPAVMLAFVAVIEAGTLVMRCVFADAGKRSLQSRSYWSQRVGQWAYARPRPPSSTARNRAISPGPAAPHVVSAVGWKRRA